MTLTSAVWCQLPPSLALPVDEVHVWRAPLEQPHDLLHRLRETLTSDERERAARFHFERDRGHFIVARGLLRAILGRYLNLEPGRLRFVYQLYGKPYLTDESGGGWLRFNVSHAGELALYAISRCREVGVDIEKIRTDIEHRQIARQFFSEREVAAFSSLPEHLQHKAFFLCWTRKEAYIKGIGEGLSLPLCSFDVSLVPGEPPTLLAVRGSQQEASRWTLRGLEPGPGYEAALVAEGHDWNLKCWQWAD
ncbi:MAG: 4'-phosphopantetheinyl transferase family protein [Pyrinomonadaceae bacterium]